MIALIIEVYNRQKSLPISSPAVKKIVGAVLALQKQACDEVTMHFVTSKKICELHEKYFNDPSTTDCISFPLDDPQTEQKYTILGEVFVCPQTAIHYAQEHGVDPYEECTLYIVHGLLHLMGYDDLEPKEKKRCVELKKGICLT